MGPMNSQNNNSNSSNNNSKVEREELISAFIFINKNENKPK